MENSYSSSSSSSSLDFDISFLASRAGADCLDPPFSFCAAIISCLLISASSISCFFFSSSSAFLSAASFFSLSSSCFFSAASFLSCSALISFLLACLSFSLLSSSSSLALWFLHSPIYSFSCSFSSLCLMPDLALAKASSPFFEVLEVSEVHSYSSSDIVDENYARSKPSEQLPPSLCSGSYSPC